MTARYAVLIRGTVDDKPEGNEIEARDRSTFEPLRFDSAEEAAREVERQEAWRPAVGGRRIVARVAKVQPCPRCKGRGTVSEDPAPDCPSVAYAVEECAACDGSGEVQPTALCPCGERAAPLAGHCDECRADARDPGEP